MKENQKKSRLNWLKSGQIHTIKRVMFTKLLSVINFAKQKFTRVAESLLLLNLNNIKVKHMVYILEGNSKMICRFRFAPYYMLRNRITYLINLIMSKLDISSSDNINDLESNLLSSKIKLIILRNLMFVLLKKYSYGFDINLNLECEKILRRFGLKLDDEQLFVKLDSKIKQLETEIENAIKQIDDKRDDMFEEKTKSASESILSLLYGISSNMNIQVNRDMYLSDFFVIYELYKDRVKIEKQNLKKYEK